MMNFDEVAPHFDRAKDRWPEASTLANHYEAVVGSYDGNCHGLVETVKSFIECVCITILVEFGKPMPSSSPSTTELFVEALKVLGLQNTRGASKFDRVLSAHNKLADALSEMRNEGDPIAHGKDGFLDSLTSNHTRAFLLTGDTILCLLLSALDGKDPDLQFTREPYERFLHLHERIDRAAIVKSSIDDVEDSPIIVLIVQTPGLPEGIELRVEPSRLLYSIDRTAYIELLAAAVSEEMITPTAEEISEEPHIAGGPLPAVQDIAPAPEVRSSYDGVLSPLKGELERYLDSLGLTQPTPEPDGAQIVDSLLAVVENNMGKDWKAREALQAKMKVTIRRTLVRFGIDHNDSKTYAEHLVSWFRIQVVDIPGNENDAPEG